MEKLTESLSEIILEKIINIDDNLEDAIYLDPEILHQADSAICATDNISIYKLSKIENIDELIENSFSYFDNYLKVNKIKNKLQGISKSLKSDMCFDYYKYSMEVYNGEN